MQHHCCHHGRPVFFGIILLVIGLMLRYGYDIAAVLVVVGVLLIAKGLLFKFKMKEGY